MRNAQTLISPGWLQKNGGGGVVICAWIMKHFLKGPSVVLRTIGHSNTCLKLKKRKEKKSLQSVGIWKNLMLITGDARRLKTRPASFRRTNVCTKLGNTGESWIKPLLQRKSWFSFSGTARLITWKHHGDDKLRRFCASCNQANDSYITKAVGPCSLETCSR